MEPLAYDGQEFAVFVLLEDPDDVTGVTLRLETDRFGPDNVDAVTTAAGVTIEDGDIFDGITLAFTSMGEDHEPVLYVTLSGHEDDGYVWTRDVAVHRGAGNKYAPDQITVAHHFDCFGSSPHWDLPAEAVEATVGESEAVTFRAGYQSVGYPQYAEVHVVDKMGWVVDEGPVDVYASCEWCPWSWTTVVVPVYVPEGTPDKTVNEVTVEMHSFGNLVDRQSIVLRASVPVVTEETTWGRVKALYE
jgi:hypothetical protein